MDIEKEREEFSRWVLTHPDNLDITSYEENIMFDAWHAAKEHEANKLGQEILTHERFQELIAIGVKAALESQEPDHD